MSGSITTAKLATHAAVGHLDTSLGTGSSRYRALLSRKAAVFALKLLRYQPCFVLAMTEQLS
jgi:hypothetical protein